MQRKRKLIAARSQQQRKSRVSSARISGRIAPKGDVDDDAQLSPEWIRELKRRVKDSRDPVRYMLVSEFTRRFILYYNVTSDTYAMNDASRGTLFKRREAAESVKALLGKGAAIVRFTVKDGKLERLSPFLGRRLRNRNLTRRNAGRGESAR